LVSQDKYYKEVYKKVHYSGALGWFTRLVHKKIEEGIPWEENHRRVLEIGGNRAEHFPFINHKFEEYLCSDISITKMTPSDSRVTFLHADAQDLPFPKDSMDRVLNACVLHHVPDAIQALREIRRVVVSGGRVSIYVPFDPGMFYRYLRHLTSHLKQSKVGRFGMRQTKELWAREHINHALGLMNHIQEVFVEDSISARRWPFPFLSWNFNLFIVYQIRVKKQM